MNSLITAMLIFLWCTFIFIIDLTFNYSISVQFIIFIISSCFFNLIFRLYEKKVQKEVDELMSKLHQERNHTIV